MYAKTTESGFHFKTIEDMMQHSQYQEFVYLKIYKEENIEVLPKTLPKLLQVLIFDNNKIKELPNIPSTIRTISGRTNKISTIPDLSHCIYLETLDLYDNHVLNISNKLPPKLRTLELSFNKVRAIDYDSLPDSIVSFGMSYNFITQHPPEKWRSKIIYDHNDIEKTFVKLNNADRPYFIENHDVTAPYNPDPNHHVIVPIVYSNAQNVHTHSIQSSLNKSLKYILSYEPKRTNDLYVEDIKQLFCTKRSFLFFSWTSYDKGMNRRIDLWCADKTIHSSHGVTFKRVLQQVWAIIQDHEYKDTMQDVLKEELLSSIGMCFTGRFTRVINSLSGFIQKIQIGISSREQMQNQIAMVATKNEDICTKRKEVESILKSHDVDKSEWSSWLEAIV